MPLSLSLCLCLSHAVSGCPGGLVAWHLCGLLGFVIGQLHKHRGGAQDVLRQARRSCDAWTECEEGMRCIAHMKPPTPPIRAPALQFKPTLSASSMDLVRSCG